MKAAIKTGVIGTFISFSKDAPTPPKPTGDSVLVKVHAAAINPVDYKLPKFASSLIVGNDFSGEIVAIGPNSKFTVGEFVFGKAKGTLAEYTLASPQMIARVPEGWEATDCAALPIAYWSALQSLKIGGILPKNDNSDKQVLVIGASGGCGLAGIQLCAAMGVGRIVGICSAKNSDFVMEHGATEVVDYTDASALPSFYKENSGVFDCVYDTATYSGGGADYWKESIQLLKRDDRNKLAGEYTTLNGPPGKWMRALAGAQAQHETLVMMKDSGKELEEVTELLDRTGARPFTIIMKFHDEGIRNGFELLKSRRTKGKIVFDILGAEN